jgi:hypothetical protein
MAPDRFVFRSKFFGSLTLTPASDKAKNNLEGKFPEEHKNKNLITFVSTYFGFLIVIRKSKGEIYISNSFTANPFDPDNGKKKVIDDVHSIAQKYNLFSICPNE